MARAAPYHSRFAFLVEPPHVLHAVRERIAEDLAGRGAHVLVAGGQDDFVGGELGRVGEHDGVRADAADFPALLDFDGAIDDELGGPDVNVVPAAAVQVFHEDAGVVGPVVDGEAGGLKALEEHGVASRSLFGGVDVDPFCYRVRVGHVEQIGVFNRWLKKSGTVKISPWGTPFR